MFVFDNLDGFHQIFGVKVCVNFSGFLVYMANDGLQDGQLHAGADGSGDEGMAAAVWGHSLAVDLLHQITPFALGEVGGGLVLAFVAVDQQRRAVFDGFLPDLLISFDTIGANGDNAVFACFGLAAADEVILPAVDQRDGEQLSRPTAAGDQDQRDVRSM